MAGMAVAVLASCGGNGTGKVTMNNVKDTISYSIGMGRAVRVYKEQLPMDIVAEPAALKAFIKGFTEAAANPEDVELVAYAMGLEVGSQEMSQAFKGLGESLFGQGESFNKNNYLSGFLAGMEDNWSVMTFEQADSLSNALYEILSKAQYDKVRTENEAYLKKAEQDQDVVKTESGLLYKVIKLGEGGPKPTAESDVEVRYHGELIDGTTFDESEDPITLNLGGVIKGWTEGLQLMSVGDKYKFIIPYNLAYGEGGQGSIKPYSTLIFEVELVSIK